MDTNEVEADARPPRSGLKFPGAVTTLAIVTVLVWVAALFIPSGRYLTDVDGSPIPGTFEQVPSPLNFSETVEQLILAPVNGVYGLRNAETEFVSTETVGRIFGQIGFAEKNVRQLSIRSGDLNLMRMERNACGLSQQIQSHLCSVGRL